MKSNNIAYIGNGIAGIFDSNEDIGGSRSFAIGHNSVGKQ